MPTVNPVAHLRARMTRTRKYPSHGGRKPGSQNFTAEDLNNLLLILETKRPIGGEDWDEVVLLYNSQYAIGHGRQEREKDSLRAQWYKMLNNRKPTGDPGCQDYIRRAKRLNKSIQDEVAMSPIDDGDLSNAEDGPSTGTAQQFLEPGQLAPDSLSGTLETTDSGGMQTFKFEGPASDVEGEAEDSTVSRSGVGDLGHSGVEDSINPGPRRERSRASASSSHNPHPSNQLQPPEISILGTNSPTGDPPAAAAATPLPRRRLRAAQTLPTQPPPRTSDRRMQSMLANALDQEERRSRGGEFDLQTFMRMRISELETKVSSLEHQLRTAEQRQRDTERENQRLETKLMILEMTGSKGLSGYAGGYGRKRSWEGEE